MKNKILLLDQIITYTLQQKSRSKRVWLKIEPNGNLTVSAPQYLNPARIEELIIMKSKWIISKINYYIKHPSVTLPADYENIAEHRRCALALVHTRLEHYNKIYQFKYSKVTVRNQKTRWGSCSKKGHLSFNYKIVWLSPEQADYIIIHELCHLGQLNHSKNFWQLVAKTFPNHHEIRKGLRSIHLR